MKIIKKVIDILFKIFKKSTVPQEEISTADLVVEHIVADKPKLSTYPPIKIQEQVVTEDLICGHTLVIHESEAELNWIKFKSTDGENK